MEAGRLQQHTYSSGLALDICKATGPDLSDQPHGVSEVACWHDKKRSDLNTTADRK